MSAEIRKTLLHVEDTLIEGGKLADTPLKLIAAIAVIRNPWAGQGFVEDLGPAIRDCAPGLGELLTKMILDASGGGDRVEAYGKSAIVGLNGEVEHASALIHTLQFGRIEGVRKPGCQLEYVKSTRLNFSYLTVVQSKCNVAFKNLCVQCVRVRT